MKTLLVIAKASGLAAAIRSAVDPSQYRVLAQEEAWAAEPMLRQAAIDACLLDAELTDIQPIRIIKNIRRLSPHCPILIFTAVKQWEWEEEAYLLGVDHILAKPVRGRLLNAMLDRLWSAPSQRPAAALEPAPRFRESGAPERVVERDRALEVLKDFSEILSHSLCSESLLKEFLLLLREILGVNRAAIFLRSPPSLAPEISAAEDRLLRPVCALGLASGTLEHFALSIESGIGRYVYRAGRILKNGSDEARGDLEAQKEFSLLGAQVAIPILDRESLVGVAVFDGRLTGEFFDNEELALIFHLLEGVGLAIKNSWLHDQLQAGHEMMADMLDQLGGGCVVVDGQLQILHANPAARRFLKPAAAEGEELAFRDFPQAIASKLFDLVKNGRPQPDFKYRPDASRDKIYSVRIASFKTRNAITANAVLLLIDDISHQERLHQLELEAAHLRFIKSMAAQLAHEIGNSMVPIRTLQELNERKPHDEAMRETMSRASLEGTRRIARLTKQMQFLADDQLGSVASHNMDALLARAVEQAGAHSEFKPVQLRRPAENGDPAPAPSVLCDLEKLAYALSEIILNGQQASPKPASVRVRWLRQPDAGGSSWICLEIEDEGPGFSPEAARRATEPFFSTRTVGSGLGLAVARKIVEQHHGRLEISGPVTGSPNVVRVFLPEG